MKTTLRIEDGHKAGRVLEVQPITTVYSCGPLVLQPAHIGQLRQYVVVDVFRRAVELLGGTVKQAIMITDLARDAGEKFVDAGAALEAADTYQQLFIDDLRKLRVTPPELMPRTSELVPTILRLIESLVERGAAYSTSTGVYFDVGSHSDTADEAPVQSRVRSDLDRRHPADFALWRLDPDGEALIGYASPWGTGIPGMHVPCVAAWLMHFERGLDLHTGTESHRNLHHVNEIRLMEALSGEDSAPGAWLRVGLVGAEGAVMARGRAPLLNNLRESGFAPDEVRYLLLQSHYTSPVTMDVDTLTSARTALRRLRLRIARLELPAPAPFETAAEVEQMVSAAAARHLERLIDHGSGDLATPALLAALPQIMGDPDLSPQERSLLITVAERLVGIDLRE